MKFVMYWHALCHITVNYVCVNVFWSEWRHECWRSTAECVSLGIRNSNEHLEIFWALALRLFPGGVKSFNFYSGTECVFFVLCPVLFPAVTRTCTDHTFREVRPCVCLVFWSTVFCSPYRHLTQKHLGCKSRGCKS